jgi:hypothetical protein
MLPPPFKPKIFYSTTNRKGEHQAWWHTSDPRIGVLKLEDCEFEPGLGNIMRPYSLKKEKSLCRPSDDFLPLGQFPSLTPHLFQSSME